jgi:DNA replication and repair protein RecF
MLLERIEAIGFRNLEGSVQCGPGLNIFYGDNAQGKTNWLEAIYLAGNTKSFRTKQLKDLIAFESDAAIVRASVLHGSIVKELQIQVSDPSRQLYINGKREAQQSYLGNLDVFVFSPEEMGIIRGEPAERRRFLDRGIVTILPGYLRSISQYNHIIKQKNRLLQAARDSETPDVVRPQVEAWNEELVELGAVVHNARTEYVDRLNRVLAENDQGRDIFGAERIAVRYRSQLEGKGDLSRYSELFRERLAVRLPAEIAAGHSLIGPHRDDLEVEADGRELARFGSAGQQKSALFILDLAQVSVYNYIYEESPVLLIDDIDAELDRGRIEAVLSELEGQVQTFVSTSRRGIAGRYRDRARVFLVESGKSINEASMGNCIAQSVRASEPKVEPSGSDETGEVNESKLRI